MPISDEIIELAPVKKTKSKLIIMFAVMGVLFALAVTFLILYFLKPSAVADNGKVLNVGISSSSELFSTTDGEGNQIYTASVGNDYTVYATVAVEGGKSPEVKWIVEPSDKAIEIKDSGRVTDKTETNGTLISATSDVPEYKFYCTFSPNEEYAGQKITLAAMSTSSDNKIGKVEFTVVKQGTEHIVLNTYRRGSNGAQEAIENDTLELPWFAAANFKPDPSEAMITTNDYFYVNFTQYGEYDVSTDSYSKITIDRTQNSNNVRIDVVSGGDVINLASQNPGASRFSFKLKKVGTAVIKIVANVNNDYIADGRVVSKTLTIKSVSSASLGYIDGMYFTQQPVTAETFAALKNTSVPPADILTDTLTVPYSIATYTGIMSHVILTPYSLQYDATTGKLKDDWQNKIEITSSDKSICTITGSDITCRKLAANSECTLRFNDKSANSIGVYKNIKLNIVAPVNQVNLDYKTSSGGKPEIDASTGAIKSALGASYGMTVTYNITVPAGTDPKTLIAKGYLSGNFKIEAESNFVSVKTKNGKDIKLGETTSLNENDMTFTGTGTTITGTAEFIVTIKDKGIVDDEYELKFTKFGIMFGDDPDKQINTVNPEIVKTTNFKIEATAKHAYFVKDKDKIDNIVTAGGTQAGKFVDTSDSDATDAFSATVYVQAKAAGAFLSSTVDLIKLIDKDGTGDITGKITGRSSFKGTIGGDYKTLEFISIQNLDNCSATLTFTVTDYHETIATFIITVRLVNEIRSIECANTETATMPYESTKLLSFAREKIVPNRVLNIGNESLTNEKTTVSMYYEDLDGKKPFVAVEDKDAGLTYFRLAENGKDIFSFNGSRFNACVDLFAAAYQNGIPLSTIYVRYTTVSEANYVQEPRWCERTYNLVRYADSVKLFDDEYCMNEVVYDNTAKSYIPEMNQGKSEDFWVSSVVHIALDNGTEKDVVIEQERHQGTVLSEVEASYISLPSKNGLLDVSGKPFGDIQNAYLSIRFTAPDVSNNEVSQEHEFSLISARRNEVTPVVLTVNNRARRVVSVGLFADDKGDNSITEFDFGLYNNTATGVKPYTKEAYIIVTYVAASEGVYSYFESATLKIPDYLELKLGEGEYLAYSQSGYEIKRGDTYVGDAETKFVQKCTFRVLDSSVNHSGDTANEVITLGVEASSVVGHEAKAKVDAGLDNISYTVNDIEYNTDGGQQPTVNLMLKYNGDAEQKCVIPFKLNALVGTGYNKLAYNKSNISITSNNLTGTGLSASGALSGELVIAADGTKTVSNQLVSFTVTDTAGYATGGKTFNINIMVNVTTDIYEVKLLRSAINVTTTGGSGFVDYIEEGKKVNQLTLIINNNNTNFVPNEDVVRNINVAIVKKSGNGYIEHKGEDITVDKLNSDIPKGIYILKISNSVITTKIDNVESYFVALSYGTLEPKYYPIIVTTTANELRLGADGNSITVNPDRQANVTVGSASDRFKLGATVYNRGTGEKVESGVTVTYELYDNSERTDLIADSKTTAAANAVADIDAFGVIRFIKPDASGTGTLYYRAKYTDSSSGKEYVEDVAINYLVTIAKISLDFGKPLMLYYMDGSHYTQVDLKDHIVVETAFAGVAIPTSGVTVSVKSNDTGYISVVNGHTVRPLQLRVDDSSITVSATYYDSVYGTTTVNQDYSVSTTGITAPRFTFDKNSVEIVSNETATLTPDVVTYDWLGYTYSIVSYNNAKFTITPSAGDISGDLAAGTTLSISLKRNGFTGQADYDGDYKFKLRVKYSALPSAMGTLVGGSFDSEYSLKVTWALTGVSFNIVESKDGNESVYAGGTVTAPTAIEHDSKAAYKLQLDLSGVSESFDGKYVVASDNVNIVSFGSSKSNTATLTDSGVALNTGDGFGTVMLTVTANVYGKSLGFAKYFTVTYNGATTVALETSADNGSTFKTATSGSTLNVDFDNDTHKRLIRYYIDVSGVGIDVKAEDISVVYSGNVTANTTTDGGMVFKAADGRYYAEFVANKPTTFTARGTIIVGGRTFYADTATLELTASEPDFTFGFKVGGAESSQLYQESTATLAPSFVDNGFKGEHDIEYTLVSGGEYVTLVNGVLTPKKNATSDHMIIVGATIKVTGGAYAGKTYYKERALTLRGVSLPKLELVNIEKTLTVTGNFVTEDIAGNFVLGKGIANGKQYDYSGKVDYNYSITPPAGYTAADYSISGSRITVNNTDKARAGGSFTVSVSATIKSGEINAGSVVTSDVYTVIVRPQACAVSGVSVSGQKGGYDIRSSVKPFTSDSDGQVKDGDKYNVSFALKNGTTVITVGGVSKQLGDVVKVSGGTLTILENITSNVTVQLAATVAMADGAYAGEVMTCDTTVVVNGFTIVAKDIDFASVVEGVIVNAYGELDVADWVSAVVSGTISQIDVYVVTSGAGAFVKTDYTDKAAPIVTFDNDINVSLTQNRRVVRIGFAVYTDNGVYYGEGDVNIAAIHPETMVRANDEILNDPYAVELIGGSSVSFGLNEEHGLDIENVTVRDAGDSLAVTVSGANIMFTAADIVTTVTANVEISYRVCDVNQSLRIAFVITPRPSEDLFIVTNKTVTVSSSAYEFVSKWTPSLSNNYVYGKSISISLSNNDYVTRKISSITFTGYDASGGAYTKTGSIGMIDRTVNISPNSSVPYKYFQLTIGVKQSCTLKVTYTSANSADGNSTVRTEVTYNIIRSSSSQVPVTFDANGGTFADGNSTLMITHNYGNASRTYMLPSVPPTREGYELDGWYFEADGTGLKVTSDMAVAYGYDHVIYAKWKVADYSVTLDKNDGMGINDVITVTFGQTFSGKLTVPTRTGYAFNGWYTSENVRVTDSTVVTAAFDNATLHAEWTAVSYSITLDADGGSFKTGNTMPTVTFDQQYPDLAVPERAGYTFGGWYTQKDGLGTAVTDATGENVNLVKVSNENEHSLYAKWTANRYTVQLNGNGGNLGSASTIDVTYGEAYEMLVATVITRDGYTFDGWYITKGDTEIMVFDSNSVNVNNVKVSIASNHFMYAKWTANEYALTIDADGGSGAPDDTTVTFGGTFPETLGTVPTKTGYTFDGWWTVDESGNITADSIKVVSGMIVNVTGNITLKAKWTANTYTVVLVTADGADIATGTVITIAYGENVKFDSLPTPEVDGYDFDGWYSDASFNNAVDENTTVFDASGKLAYTVLFAKFTPQP